MTGVFSSVNCSETIGIVTRLQAGRKRNRSSIPGRGKLFFSLQSVETGCGNDTNSYAVRTFGCYVRGGGGERSSLDTELTTYLSLMRKLRMCGIVLCVFCYIMCICCTMCAFFFFTLDAGLLARSQYSEGPATGHLDTGFSWFPCV